MRFVITLAMLPVALGATVAIAHPAAGMMDGTNPRRMMAAGMQGCMQMMQVGQGTHKPNEQWRRHKDEGSAERGQE